MGGVVGQVVNVFVFFALAVAPTFLRINIPRNPYILCDNPYSFHFLFHYPCIIPIYPLIGELPVAA